jgi:hypothetical protein
MKAATIVVIMAIFIFTGAIAVAVQNAGSRDIRLDGGKKGPIDFPHHLHQNAIGDCNACHSVFPQKPGIIKKLKLQKELKSKQVMNKTCLKCHRAQKRAGKKTGPTKCAQCHVK